MEIRSSFPSPPGGIRVSSCTVSLIYLINCQYLNTQQFDMSLCTFFLKPCDNPPNLEQLKGRIASPSLEEKAGAVKELIKCLASDESYPPLIMHIITNIIPAQHRSNELRKAMLLYWEIVEKAKSPTDKSLKEEVFLACNSLRNDLIGHNEYLRGRTLRLVSRIMHKGVIEPLSNAITSNLTHKSAYVRRNAVICLYNIYMHFGSDVIGEIEDEIEELLKKETDLSTKRNAFILLNKSNPLKAMEYLDAQIKGQAVEEIGDILQLAILKILKIKCKEDPTQKPKLLRIVADFQEKATESVMLECALTATAISNSASTIKASLGAYVNILSKTSEINIKKIILDKLEIVCKNSNYLEDDMIEDLLKGLSTPGVEVKVKIVDIVMTSLTSKSAELTLKHLEEMKLGVEEVDLVPKILSLLELIAYKFTAAHSSIFHYFFAHIADLEEFTAQSTLSLCNIFTLIFRNGSNDVKTAFITLILEHLDRIVSVQLLTIVLNELSVHLKQEKDIELTIARLRAVIGALPLQVKQEQEEDGKHSGEKKGLRYYLINDSIFGGVFARSISKLLYNLRRSNSFNRFASPILLVLCSLLRSYQSNLCFVDQAVIDQITVILRKIVDTNKFVKTEDRLFESSDDLPLDFTFNEKKTEMIEKNPEDLLHFRLLKRTEDVAEFDYDDEQVNDILEQAVERVDYISKLKSIVQLTGSFDPLYSQAFIRVNKYDLFFEILLINNSKSNLLNIQIEFSSSVEVLILEKAQSVNLRPSESVFLRTQLRFSESEFGVIYGFINYDNQAGLEQPYLITEEISIDYMQFVEPAELSETAFKLEWQKAEHEIVFETELPNRAGRTFSTLIQGYEKILHARLVGSIASSENQYFLNCHLFGKSKLGENFFVNLALFAGDSIHLSATIRSKDKAVRDIIYKELLSKRNADPEVEA